MENIKLGKVFEDDATNINDVEKALSLVGIRLREEEGGFRSMADVLDELSSKWDQIGELEQRAVATAIGGLRQREVLLTLLGEQEKVQKAMILQQAAENLAQKRYAIYLESVEAAQEKFLATKQKLWQNFIPSDLVRDVIDLGTGILTLIDQIGGLSSIIVVATAALVLYNSQHVLAFGTNLTSAIASIPRLIAGINAYTFGLNAATIATANLAIGISGLVAAFLVYRKLQKDAEDGIKNVASAWEEANRKLIEVEASNTEVLDRYRKAMDNTNAVLDKQWFYLRALIDEEKLREDLAKVTIETLGKTSKTFEEYSRALKETALYLGYSVDETGRFYTLIPTVDGIVKEYSNSLWGLSDAEFEAGRISGILGEEVEFVGGAFREFSDVLDGIQDKITVIDDAITSFGKGEFGVEDIQKLAEAYPEYLEALEIEGDSLTLNTEKLKEYKKELIETAIAAIKAAGPLTESAAKQVEILEFMLKTMDKMPSESGGFFLTGFEEERERLDETLTGYQALSDAIGQFGETSQEAYEALQKFLGEGADIQNFLTEEGAVNIDALKSHTESYFSWLNDAIINSTELSEEMKAALLGLLNETANAISNIQGRLVDGIYLNQYQFQQFATDVSQVLFDAANNAKIVLVDIAGNTLNSAENVKVALMNKMISYDQLMAQLKNSSFGYLTQVAEYGAQLTGFLTGGTPYKPVAPNYTTLGGGGGGSGGSQAESPEKKRIQADIDELLRKKKALQDNLKAFKKYIDLQKESLKLLKEEKEFNDSLQKKNKELGDLKTEIMILGLDDSEEAKAKRLQLEEEAMLLEEEINKDSEDRKYELQIQALEKLESEYQEGIEYQIELIDMEIQRLKDEAEALNSVGGGVSSVTSQYQYQGSVVAQVVDSIIAKLKENKDSVAAVESEMRTLITSWVSAGLSADEAYAKAVRYYDYLSSMGGGGNWQTNAPSATTGTGAVAAVPHHSGGFVGGLKSNEEFAKLLDGELVVTQSQMDKFMKYTLPGMAKTKSVQSSSGSVKIDKLLNVEGNLDSSVMPNVEKLLNAAVEKLNSTMLKRGFLRQTNSFST